MGWGLEAVFWSPVGCRMCGRGWKIEEGVEGDNMLICCLLSIAQINWTPFDLLFPLNLSIDLFSQTRLFYVNPSRCLYQ